MTAEPNVKKVKPYPFSGQLKDARGSFSGQIVRLTIQGLMIEVPSTSVQPGEKVEVNFVTPILGGSVVVAGLVVKVYNQLTSTSLPTPAPPGGFHLLEIHFASVPAESMNHIAMFLEATGQAKRV